MWVNLLSLIISPNAWTDESSGKSKSRGFYSQSHNLFENMGDGWISPALANETRHWYKNLSDEQVVGFC